MVRRQQRASGIFHDWITARVAGQSFIDIGGIGEWSVNETVGTALAGGASKAAVADIAGFGSPFWPHFHARIAKRGFGRDRYDSYDRVDIVAGDLASRLPVFNIVHSTGVRATSATLRGRCGTCGGSPAGGSSPTPSPFPT